MEQTECSNSHNTELSQACNLTLILMDEEQVTSLHSTASDRFIVKSEGCRDTGQRATVTAGGKGERDSTKI